MSLASNSYLLDNLVRDTKGLQAAFAVSADGLLLVRSIQLGTDDADVLSAATCGLMSLANGVALHLLEVVDHIVITMTDRYLCLMQIGDGSHLAAIADEMVDLGALIEGMSAIIVAVGDRGLTPERRF